MFLMKLIYKPFVFMLIESFIYLYKSQEQVLAGF